MIIIRMQTSGKRLQYQLVSHPRESWLVLCLVSRPFFWWKTCANWSNNGTVHMFFLRYGFRIVVPNGVKPLKWQQESLQWPGPRHLPKSQSTGFSFETPSPLTVYIFQCWLCFVFTCFVGLLFSQVLQLHPNPPKLETHSLLTVHCSPAAQAHQVSPTCTPCILHRYIQIALIDWLIYWLTSDLIGKDFLNV